MAYRLLALATSVSLLALIGSALGAGPTADELDPTFGRDGIIVRDFGRYDDGYGVAVDDRGRTVVAGDFLGERNRRIFVARFRRDGKLDRTFSRDGVSTAADNDPNRPTATTARDLAIQDNGRIVVVGYHGYADEQGGDFYFSFTVVRFRPDGRLDRGFASFRADGIAEIGFPGTPSAQATSVAVDPRGRIVVGGGFPYVGLDRFAIARLERDGELDTTFSGDGLATSTLGYGVNGLALQGRRIVVAGGSEVVRFQADGEVDESFGSVGRAHIDFGENSFYATASALTSDDRVVVAGILDLPRRRTDFAVARLTADGQADGSFSGNGKATVRFNSRVADARALEILESGKLLVAGESRDNNGPGLADDKWKFALARFTADGVLDRSFSGNGKAVVSLGEGSVGEVGAAAADARGGGVLIAGTAFRDEDIDTALIRVRD